MPVQHIEMGHDRPIQAHSIHANLPYHIKCGAKTVKPNAASHHYVPWRHKSLVVHVFNGQ
jgi:hypothetical protein